tara:strand:+ start:146 stop:604 length:459 start_codon:yes stop_codon:yes gene_type:complete
VVQVVVDKVAPVLVQMEPLDKAMMVVMQITIKALVAAALAALGKLGAELPPVQVALEQIIAEHLEPVTVYLEYLLVVVVVDLTHTVDKEQRREPVVLAEAGLVGRSLLLQRQLKVQTELQAQAVAVVVARLIILEKLAVVMAVVALADQESY